jgi:hypothetical protein
VLPLGWSATGHGHLLPTFEGALEISKRRSLTRLRLAGEYTVPLGLLGRIGDDVFGWRVARRSLNALVERMTARLEAEVQSRAVDLRGVRRPRGPYPEIYVG